MKRGGGSGGGGGGRGGKVGYSTVLGYKLHDSPFATTLVEHVLCEMFAGGAFSLK